MKLNELTIAQAKSVSCPRCGVEAGKDCKYTYMGESRDGLHRQRRILAKSVLDSPQRQRGGSSTNLKIVREVSD